MTLVQSEPKKIVIWGLSRLPAEYQEVEYIESSGTQWIDTGLNAGIGYRINMKIYTYSSSITDQTVIGGSGPSNTEAIYCGLNYNSAYNSIYRGYNNQWFDANNTIAVGNTYEIESIIRNGTQKLTVNGTVKFTGSLSLSGTGTNHMAIFSRRGSNYALIKLYSMQIYNSSDTLVRNFVPCYRKQDAVIGLYDLVNNQFYINSGTGIFTKGANIGGEKEIKKIVVFPDGVTEKQIRPAGWQPGANTLFYLPFNGDCDDHSGNSVVVTQGGRIPTYGTTVSGEQYAEFTGQPVYNASTCTYLDATITLSGSGNWTVSHWINRDTQSSSQASAVWGYGVDDNNRGFGIIINSSYKIVIFIYLSDINTQITLPSGWHNITMTHSNGSTTIYLDGVSVYTNTRNYATSGYLKMLGDPNHHGNAMNGYLDEFIVEDKTWTAQEISDYYNLTKGNYGL